MIGSARAVAKSKPDKAHQPVYDLWLVATLAGAVDASRRLLLLMYGRLPPAKKVLTVLSTHALDGISRAAGFGDVTGGEPSSPYGLAGPGSLHERVTAAAHGMMVRLTGNAFQGEIPTDDAWRRKPVDDPWRAIDRWRRVQGLVQPGEVTAARERDALERLDEILADVAAGARPVGGGNEVTLALDLALRHGQADRARAWVMAHAGLVRRQVEALACLPTPAQALVSGFFAPASAHPRASIEAEVEAVEAAVDAAMAAPSRKPTAKVPKVQRRRVTVLYAQVYLEPPELTGDESAEVYFQDERESAQGMSLFATKVGIATPSETESVDVRVVIELDAERLELGDALQAVSFPLHVRAGGVCVRGVADEQGEPLVIPPGRYDVAALFTAAGKPRGGLRKLGLSLSFRRAGALDAPRVYRMADGEPPADVVSNAS